MRKDTSGPAILSRLFSLEGRNAVVTGGTSGIGHMIASALVQAGAKTYVVARKAKQCEQVSQELSAVGECHPCISQNTSDLAISWSMRSPRVLSKAG